MNNENKEYKEHSGIPTKLVVAGILWRGHEFLAAQRPEGKAHAGYWEFPGGKVEAGESLEKALVRELEEELGVTAKVMYAWQVVRHVYNNSASLQDKVENNGNVRAEHAEAFAVEVHFYHVTDFDGEPIAHEGHGLAWMTRDIAVTYPFLEADRPLVATLPLRQPFTTIFSKKTRVCLQTRLFCFSGEENTFLCEGSVYRHT